jgi:hypothetical protein
MVTSTGDGLNPANVYSQRTQSKSVGDPIAAFSSMLPLWERSRAILGGARKAKQYDQILDSYTYGNMLIPFSPTMNPQQYSFYLSESELPGLSSQYSKVIIGGLLRKKPELELPKDCPEECMDWLLTDFGSDNANLISWLHEALWEELQTSRAWIGVNYPEVPEGVELTPKEQRDLKPFPVLYKAENIINWKRGKHPITGVDRLEQVIVRMHEERFVDNEFHADIFDVVYVHELDAEGFYQVRKFERKQDESAGVSNGSINLQQVENRSDQGNSFTEVGRATRIIQNGERLEEIPMYPLNGSIECMEPILTPLVDKEIAVYNKMSRRNHLLYGAATYTPVVASDITDEEFQEIVDAGLGSWIRVRQGDEVTALETPTDALKDYDRAINDGINEIANLGARMLNPEVRSGQSGIELDIRHSAQKSLLSALNTKVSQQMRRIIAMMINWRYDMGYTESDIMFTLSADFNPSPIGEQYLRLVTEWYESGLIPRSVWIEIAKQNDVIDSEYNDELGQDEIKNDDLVMMGLNPQLDPMAPTASKAPGQDMPNKVR